jgi:hypothetical protein
MRILRTLLLLAATTACSANDRLPTDLGDATLLVRRAPMAPQLQVTNVSQDAVTVAVHTGSEVVTGFIIPCAGERLEPGITRFIDISPRESSARVTYCPLPTPKSPADAERGIWVTLREY